MPITTTNHTTHTNTNTNTNTNTTHNRIGFWPTVRAHLTRTAEKYERLTRVSARRVRRIKACPLERWENDGGSTVAIG